MRGTRSRKTGFRKSVKKIQLSRRNYFHTLTNPQLSDMKPTCDSFSWHPVPPKVLCVNGRDVWVSNRRNLKEDVSD